MLYEGLNEELHDSEARLTAALRTGLLGLLSLGLWAGSRAAGGELTVAPAKLAGVWALGALGLSLSLRWLRAWRHAPKLLTHAAVLDAVFITAFSWLMGGSSIFAFGGLMFLVVTNGVFQAPARARWVYGASLLGLVALSVLPWFLTPPEGLIRPAFGEEAMGLRLASGLLMLSMMGVAAYLLDRLARRNRAREGQMRAASRRLRLVNEELTEKQFALLCSQQDLLLSNERLRQKSEEVLKSRDVIRTLALAVEARDPYTEGHSTRVAGYAGALAREVGLTREEQEMIRHGCLLHDIGKINVPDLILRKPGSLEEEEYSLMRRHPEIGEQICRPLIFARPFLDIIRHHHERWDGKGYPDGLRGEEISFSARIAAVADAWDAMTSDRPYRKALPLQVAMQRLKDGAGSQWDPAMVDAYLRLVERHVDGDDQAALAELAWSEPIY